MASSSSWRGFLAATSVGDQNMKRKISALDFGTLDCPICLEPLDAPVYQCHNGHAICGGCCKKLTTGLCPSCSLPIGTNRCIAVEKIVESLQVHCKYAAFGCKNVMQYSKLKIRDDHEGVCKFRQYLCPCVGCNLKVSKAMLVNHLLIDHGTRFVSYEKPHDDNPLNKVKNSFTLSTDNIQYDITHSQYVIVDFFRDQDSENQDFEDWQDCRELFLIHYQFHEKEYRYSFSLTSFGTCRFDYSLSVTAERDGHYPVSGSRRTFKSKSSFEGPVYDNQRDKALLGEVVRLGDCLSIPRLPASWKDWSKFEVEYQIVARKVADPFPTT